jgi:hypothetical protein
MCCPSCHLPLQISGRRPHGTPEDKNLLAGSSTLFLPPPVRVGGRMPGQNNVSGWFPLWLTVYEISYFSLQLYVNDFNELCIICSTKFPCQLWSGPYYCFAYLCISSALERLGAQCAPYNYLSEEKLGKTMI